MSKRNFRIGVTSGRRGFCAVLYDVDTGEPWGKRHAHSTVEAASVEAIQWAIDEGVTNIWTSRQIEDGTKVTFRGCGWYAGAGDTTILVSFHSSSWSELRGHQRKYRVRFWSLPLPKVLEFVQQLLDAPKFP